MTNKSGLVTAAVIIGLTVAVGLYSYYASGAPSTVNATPSSCKAPDGYVLFVAGASGYNDSVNHARPWPVITVREGETVKLFLCNDDPASAHGFAIDYYVSGGLALKPGRTATVSFVADRTGDFAIYCNIFCPIHTFMRAQLRVTP